MKYENKKTKQRAEVVSEDEYSVTLTDVETGETQSITHAEFKKDWKKVREKAQAAEVNAEPKAYAENEEAQAEEVRQAKNLLGSLYDTINAAFFGNRLPALEDIEISLAPRAFNRYSYNPEANTVMIGAGLLNASLESVAILVYRLAVYVNCNQNHVDPTCSGGRYHNRVFQRMAEAAGFTVEHNRSVGYGILTPDENFAVTVGYDAGQMAAMFLPTELLPVKSAKAPAARASKPPFVQLECPVCGVKAKAREGVALICGECNAELVAAN